MPSVAPAPWTFSRRAPASRSSCSSTSGTTVAAGADPVAWINANPGRSKSIHCKDWKAGETGYAVLFGEGDAPWKGIFAAAEKTGGVESYIIEQEQGPAEGQLARAEQCLANWKKLRA